MRPNVVNLCILLVFLTLGFCIPIDRALWENRFSDPGDYIKQSKIPISSLDFYAPKRIEGSGFDPRPFTIPLIYKLCGSKENIIIRVQQLLHYTACFCLIAAMMMFFSSSLMKYIFMVFMYGLMSWWNVFGWSMILLSESIQFSLFLFWFSTLLWVLYDNRKTWVLVLHLLVAVLFSFSRDNYPYILLAVYFLIFALKWISNKNLPFKWLMTLTFTVILFMIQSATSKRGQRTMIPVMNNIILKIVPNQQYLNWFVERGMPSSDLLIQNFQKEGITRIDVYRTYNSPQYQDLRNWCASNGKNLYTRFLISHPNHAFLILLDKGHRVHLFPFNTLYTKNPKGFTKYFQALFPWIKGWILIILLVIMYLYTKTRNNQLLIPLLLFVIFVLNTLLMYNADALEHERHLIYNLPIIHIIGILSMIEVFDAYLPKLKKLIKSG